MILDSDCIDFTKSITPSYSAATTNLLASTSTYDFCHVYEYTSTKITRQCSTYCMEMRINWSLSSCIRSSFIIVWNSSVTKSNIWWILRVREPLKPNDLISTKADCLFSSVCQVLNELKLSSSLGDVIKYCALYF